MTALFRAGDQDMPHLLCPNATQRGAALRARLRECTTSAQVQNAMRYAAPVDAAPTHGVAAAVRAPPMRPAVWDAMLVHCPSVCLAYVDKMAAELEKMAAKVTTVPVTAARAPMALGLMCEIAHLAKTCADEAAALLHALAPTDTVGCKRPRPDGDL